MGENLARNFIQIKQQSNPGKFQR